VTQCVGVLFFLLTLARPGIIRDAQNKKPHERGNSKRNRQARRSRSIRNRRNSQCRSRFGPSSVSDPLSTHAGAQPARTNPGWPPGHAPGRHPGILGGCLARQMPERWQMMIPATGFFDEPPKRHGAEQFPRPIAPFAGIQGSSGKTGLRSP
jgi:hypothetical protein